jgi:adenosine deaminase
MTDQHKASRRPDRQWLLALPKAEVHVHLEGCIPRELLARAAARAGVALPRQGPFDGLADMLVSLDAACGLLDEAEDIVQLALAYGRTTVANGVVYSDVIMNPGHWPTWQPQLAQLIALLDRGFSLAEEEGAAPIGLCLSIGRWLSAGDANQLVDTVAELRHPRVVGVSLDGNEAAPGAGTERFVPALDRARSLGLGVAVHAGESSGPDGVRQAIGLLRADRIDHGIRAVGDPDLLRELSSRGTPLDVCPTSNIQLKLVPTLRQHPVEQLRSAGVRVSLNTDDPVLFATTLLDEYLQSTVVFDWDRRTVAALAETSIEASFATPDLKRDLLSHLAAYLRNRQ